MTDKLRNSVPDVNGVPYPIALRGLTDFRFNPLMNTIGDRVRALRKEQRITQSKLAEEIGIAPSTVSSLELGNQGTTTVLHRIAHRFGVSAHWLETGTGSKYRVEEAPAAYTPSSRPMFKTMADAVTLLREYLEIRDEPASWLADPALLQLAYQVVEEHGKAITPDDMHTLTKRLAALRRGP